MTLYLTDRPSGMCASTDFPEGRTSMTQVVPVGAEDAGSVAEGTCAEMCQENEGGRSRRDQDCLPTLAPSTPGSCMD